MLELSGIKPVLFQGKVQTERSSKRHEYTEHNNSKNLISFEAAQALKSNMLAPISFAGCGDYLAHNISKDVIDTDNLNFDIRQDEIPIVGRLVINGNWSGKPDEAKKLLEEACKNWPKGKKVKFLQSCGGLAKFDWPAGLDPEKPMEKLIPEAEKVAKEILDDKMRGKLAKITDFISFGIDSSSSPNGNFSKPHVELVCIYDIKKNKFHWTGKSYPFGQQEKGLMRVNDLDSHFLNLDGTRVMVLGCHDLSVFSPRSQAVARSEWRKDLLNGIRDRALQFKPEIVLQHPHTTDTENTWHNSWLLLTKQIPSVKAYASSGKFYNADGKERSELERVLHYTKQANTIDMIVS